VLIRDDHDLSKAYNFIFGRHENGKFYYNGPYKYFKGHHFQKGTNVPIQKLFGNANKPRLKGNKYK
jgi:hypothetical protein